MKLKALGLKMALATLGLAVCTAFAPVASAAPTQVHTSGGNPAQAGVRAQPSLGADSVTPFAYGKKVLSVGDSWAVHMEAGMQAASPGTYLYKGGHPGCGILLPVDAAPACNQWPTQWPQMMNDFRPDAVLLMVAQWDTLPQKTAWNAPPRDLSDPTQRQRFTANLDRAIGILSARNTPVYLMNSTRIQDASGREMNRLLEDAVRRHANVHLLNVRDQLCEGSICPTYIRGIPVYDVTWHTTPAAEKRLGAWILNQMFQPGYRG
ncbi:SGNH hydrolase domain-containing protein [Streptomyces shenzhenensis]|uniref:SGNH hydrolase domain-containing protein n=1 Tax=Streptomyces shenzhenensis TaxID=943815 RepID=UPI003410C144